MDEEPKDIEVNKNENEQVQGSSTWGAAAGAGMIGGLLAGLIASQGTGKLGFGAFVVFILMMMGVQGGGRKALAMLLFALAAAMVVSILR